MLKRTNTITPIAQEELTNPSVFDTAFQTSHSDRIRQVAEICSNSRDVRSPDTNQRVNK